MGEIIELTLYCGSVPVSVNKVISTRNSVRIFS